ncbi:MAG TPA: PIN domain-containing protein [Candidatus Bathyarchaeota archaeon]|nr:PIN domain-containing protein [Candidatus Bathyarchaeota archaeon]
MLLGLKRNRRGPKILRFIDSNVFIYVLVKSPKDDYIIAKRILQRIEEGEEAVTNTAVIQEIVN